MRPAHWYYIRTRQRWPAPCHTQEGAAASPSGVRRGAPLGAPYTTGTLYRACTVIHTARAFGGGQLQICVSLGLTLLARAEASFSTMMTCSDVTLTQSFFPLFP